MKILSLKIDNYWNHEFIYFKAPVSFLELLLDTLPIPSRCKRKNFNT